MIILLTSFIVATLACKQYDINLRSANEIEYIDIDNNETQDLCFKVDTKLPTVLLLVKYQQQKKKSKKNTDSDDTDAIFFGIFKNYIDELTIGSCQLTQDQRICYLEAGKEKQELKLKCTKGPCKFGVQAMQESEKQLQIGKLPKSKLKIFNIEKDDSYRITYQVKCENCLMQLVDAQLAVFGDEPTILMSDTRFVVVFNEGISKNTKLVLFGMQEFNVEVWKYSKQQLLELNHLSVDAISGKSKNIYQFKDSGIIKIKQLQQDLLKVKVRNDKQEVKLDNSYNSQNFRNYLIVWSNTIYQTLELSALNGLSYQIEIINPTVIQIEGSQLVVGDFNGITNYQLKILKNKNNFFTISTDGDQDTQVQIEECNKKCKKLESITSGKSYFSIKQNCDNEDDDGFCQFSVGVQSFGKFSLSVNENNEPIRLESNQLRISEIEEEGKHHFTYQLVDSEKLHSITFRVTSPNVQMLVSRLSKCKLVDLDCKQFSGTSETPIRISDLKDGIYSITIEGMELTKYGIIVETQLQEGINLLELKLGQVYSSTLNTKQEKQCFKYEQKGKNVITFLVHGPNHKLQAYAYTDTLDEIPTIEDHDLLSTTQALQLATEQFVACVQVVQWAFAPSINHSLTNFSGEQEWMNSKYYSDIKYSIVLYNANSVINLEFNEAYYGQIAFTETQSFSFLTYFDQDIVYITKSILSSSDARKDLQIYIGNLLHEKLTEYEYNFFDNNSTTFVLDSKKMKSLCDISDEKNIDFQDEQITQPCEIFLLVKSNSKTPVRYTLTIHKQDLAIQLTDGLQLSYNLQHIDDYMHFYYQPSNQFQDINLMASTFFGQFIIHLNVWKNDNQSHKYDWPFMDNDTSYISSGTTNQIHRTIKSRALNECFPNCLILISVQNIETANSGDFIQNDQFHIMANQGMQDIVEEQKYEVSVNYEQTIYFTFKNLQKFRDDAVLTFSLLSLIGNGYLQVTVNGGDKIEYPSLFGPYDFHSDGNYLQITKDQLNLFLQTKEISISEAYLIIAVGGIQSYINEHQKSIKLELTIHYMNMDYIQIMHASPHVVHTNINKPSIVQFYNYQNEDIFIKLHKLVGYGQMSIFICNQQGTVADCVTESNQEGFKYLDSITTAGSENSQILISKTDKTKFCIYCTYVIKLIALASDMHAQLTVVMENDFVKLPAGLQYSDYVDPHQQSQYTILFTEDSKVDIVIQILNGNPLVYYSYNQQDLENQKEIRAEKNSSYIHITIPSQRFVNNIVDVFLDEDESAVKQSHFMHDELFVRIKTKSPDSCNYTIFYTTDLINGKLQDGKIHLAVFQENNTFLYENNVEEYSILNISPFNATSLRDIDIQVAFIKKMSFDDYHIENVQNVTLKTRQIHPLQSSYELPKDKGLYEITLINKKYLPDQINLIQQVEISVTSQDIKILPFKKHYSGYTQPQGVEYFETLAPKAGFIAVEIYTCQGDVSFGYSKSSKSDLNSFIAENYDQEFKVEENYYHVELISVEKGTVWMAVHDNSTSDAYYHISSHFYSNEKDIPFGKILPGGDGNIKWTLDKQKPDSIQIEFEHVDCPKCKQKDVQVNYHIFIAQDTRKLRMLGYCRNEEFENHKATNEEIFKREPIQSYRIADHNGSLVYEIEFPNLVTYEYAVIGVMATVDNFMNSTTEMKLFYRHVQVPVPNYLAKIMNKNRTFFTFVVVGMIFLIALLTLWLCYYIKRYRRTQHQLDFQLQEGAKIIAASKLPQNDDAAFHNNITMKYDTLEED